MRPAMSFIPMKPTTWNAGRVMAMLSVLAMALSVPSLARSDSPAGAVFLYKPADVVIGLYRHWAPPRAAALQRASDVLHRDIDAFCSAAQGQPATRIDAPRASWRQAIGAWERLATVAFGPVTERRSARQIDFTPTRPQLIERAIKQAPTGAAAMERIGTPAKGFPALEWLLWTQPIAPASPACAYAVQVAADIRQEANALAAAFGTAASATWDNDSAGPVFTEFVNQWVGALERLRWQHMERPVREKTTGGQGTPLPRQASDSTTDSLVRQWSVLRELAVLGPSQALAPGKAVVPIDLYLRGRGRNPLADRWVQSIEHSDGFMQNVRSASPDSLLAAARALAETKRLAEEEIAPALEVSIGFSDADGD